MKEYKIIDVNETTLNTCAKEGYRVVGVIPGLVHLGILMPSKMILERDIIPESGPYRTNPTK